MPKFNLKIISFLDKKVSDSINNFLKNYLPQDSLSLFTEQLPLLIKILLYSTLFLLPILLLKLVHLESPKVNFLLTVILVIFFVSLFLTFFGFFLILFASPV